MYARLSDNTLLFIREIRADDKQRLADGLANLSEESVRKRFLGSKPTLSTAELRYLTEVDGHDHYAIVAMPDGEDEQISAVARFVRLDDDPRAAEAAIVVCDSLQGKGLGALLARRLSDAARERGIDRLTATISSENRPALRLMHKIDERLSAGPVGSSVTELVAQLPMAGPDDGLDEAGDEAAPAAASAA
jgi:RimJ/RimL family protein N-acetyltransferase